MFFHVFLIFLPTCLLTVYLACALAFFPAHLLAYFWTPLLTIILTDVLTNHSVQRLNHFADLGWNFYKKEELCFEPFVMANEI